MSKPPSHLKAVLLALLVTFIWSTSWVLIKIGLREVPALTFAGLRYTLAFLCLLPFLFQKNNWEKVKKLRSGEWVRFAVMGLVVYALAQGGQFLGLSYLPSVTVSLLLNLTSLFVAFFPHLIAGPVLHHSQMMPQFADKSIYRPNSANMAAALMFLEVAPQI